MRTKFAVAHAASRRVEDSTITVTVMLCGARGGFIGSAALTLDEARGFAVRLQEAIEAATKQAAK